MSKASHILIGLGANLPSQFGTPQQTLEEALRQLVEKGVTVIRCSRFWRTRPVPVSDQPWFVNAVALVESDLPAEPLLALLHDIERDFGRVRSVVNAPRVLDLDLLAYGTTVLDAPGGARIPHPRMVDRAFVLLPLQDVAPDWVHPETGESLVGLIARLPADQVAEV